MLTECSFNIIFWRLDVMERKGDCHKCGECCKTVRITAVLSNAINQHRSLEEAILYYQYRDIKVMGTDPLNDYLFLELPIRCKQLDHRNKCQIYNQPELKPILCHIYPTEKDNIPDCAYQFVPDAPIIDMQY